MLNVIDKRKGLVIGIVDVLLHGWFILHKLYTGQYFKKVKEKEIKEILIINSGYVGDSILSIPMIKAVRNKYREAKITMLINQKFIDLWRNFKSVNALLIYDAPWIRYGYIIKPRDILEYIKFIRRARKLNFDLAIDSRGDFRNNLFLLYFSKAWKRVGFGITGGAYFLTDVVEWKHQHEVENALEIANYLDCLVMENIPKLDVNEKDIDFVKHTLEKNGVRGEDLKIIIAPGAGYTTKEWPSPRWAKLMDKLIENHKAKIILVGSNADGKYKQLIDLVKNKKSVFDFIGKLSLMQSAALIKLSNLLISPDSGAMHMAAAVDCKTVSLFGPTDTVRWRPYGNEEKHFIVKKAVRCSPCGLLFKCRRNKECMLSITVEDVFGKVKGML